MRLLALLTDIELLETPIEVGHVAATGETAGFVEDLSEMKRLSYSAA